MNVVPSDASAAMPTILVVDDDPGIVEEVQAFVAAHGYPVHSAGCAVQMDAMLKTHDIDLVLLDIMMPGEDGLSVCRRLSLFEDLRIILMSARDAEVDRIVGLELGADHYLSKPFNPRELLAQIRALSRRRASPGPDGQGGADRLFRGWRLQPAQHKLFGPSGRPVPLTVGEFKMLLAFVDHPDRVFSRADLREAVDLPDTDRTSRVVDTMVSRLRAKLEGEAEGRGLILTLRNEGYVFGGPVTRG